MTIDFARLSAPFPPEQVSWRVGSTTQDKSKGMALAYIDSRDVMQRLDEVCTPAGWQCLYPHVAGKTVCNIGIKIGDEWVWKADGAGDTDVEAEKGALSDAFKRAAVKWGVGRYLYDIKSPWVAIEPAGRSYAITKPELGNLARMLAGSAAQARSTVPASSPAPRQEARPAKAEEPPDGIRARMLAALNVAKTVSDLERLTGQQAWKATLAELPEAHRVTIAASAVKRHDDLTRQPA